MSVFESVILALFIVEIYQVWVKNLTLVGIVDVEHFISEMTHKRKT
jgi:hypothetical protein